ncbi:hypothetical protein BH09MYX1_BH09MYX1_13490 [soil metagenome]
MESWDSVAAWIDRLFHAPVGQKLKDTGTALTVTCVGIGALSHLVGFVDESWGA